MKLPLRSIALLLCLCSLLCAPLSVRAQAPAPRSAVQALLINHDDRVELILALGREAAALAGPMLVATPGTPTVEAFPDGAQLFAYLAEATRPVTQVEPRYVVGISPLPGPGATPPTIVDAGAEPLPVTILTYAAGDPLPLADWVTTHQLPISPAEQLDLAAHLASGGGIVALELHAPLSAGTLPAVRISYAAEPIVPQVLGDAAQSLDLFVLAAGRQTAPQLETYYAGSMAELDPPPPPALLPLFRSNTYLTHLHSADIIATASPIAVQPAVDNTPLRRTELVQEDVYLFDRSSTAIGLGLVACTSLLALMGAVALRRRLDAINPDP